MKVLLAGASGQVGRRVEALLQERGHEVRSVRGVDLTVPGAARGMGEGCEVVVSCAGASVAMQARERRSYLAVDPVIHRELRAEAARAGVRRFVYLGVHVEAGYANCAYVQAHEMVRADLEPAGMEFSVVRPTGIYSAFADLVPMARWGVVPVVGDGRARTNPIDPMDVAEVMVGQLYEGPREVPCGGPEVMTRRGIHETVARAVGRGRVWTPRVPVGLLRWEAGLVGRFQPRLKDLLEFFSMVSVVDAVAPVVGKRRMENYKFL